MVQIHSPRFVFNDLARQQYRAFYLGADRVQIHSWSFLANAFRTRKARWILLTVPTILSAGSAISRKPCPFSSSKHFYGYAVTRPLELHCVAGSASIHSTKRATPNCNWYWESTRKEHDDNAPETRTQSHWVDRDSRLHHRNAYGLR